jgi:tetratricopeptide (TPR) repeat protein
MNDEEGDYEFILLEDAWSVYKPVVFNVASQNLPAVDDTYIAYQLDTAIANYIMTDLNPIVERVKQTGDHNKTGVALVRAKRYKEAKAEFAKVNSVAAMNNIANIYTIEQDYDNAMKMYQKVLAQDPSNKNAQTGLENLKNKLGM